MLFSTLSIASLEPAATSKTYRDSANKGFAVKIATTGTKTWLYIFKALGKTRQVNLGHFPDTSLDDALLAYLTVKNSGVKSSEGLASDSTPISSLTIKQAWKDFIASPNCSHLSNTVKKQYGESIHEFITIRGNLSVVRLDSRLIKQYVRTFNHFKTKPNKVKSAISCLCKYLVDIDELDVNPCSGLPSKTTKPKTRKFSTSELKAFLPALRASSVQQRTKDAIYIVLLTLGRVSEVVNMKVSELDLDNARWILPAERSKNGREHLIPLSEEALRILRRRLEDADGEYVFEGCHSTVVSRYSVRQALIRLCEQIDAPSTSTHDLRRTAAHHINSLGVPSELIAKLMNHTAQGVTASTYIQASLFDYEKEKRNALSKWAVALTAYGL